MSETKKHMLVTLVHSRVTFRRLNDRLDTKRHLLQAKIFLNFFGSKRYGCGQALTTLNAQMLAKWRIACFRLPPSESFHRQLVHPAYFGKTAAHPSYLHAVWAPQSTSVSKQILISISEIRLISKSKQHRTHQVADVWCSAAGTNDLQGGGAPPACANSYSPASDLPRSRAPVRFRTFASAD